MSLRATGRTPRGSRERRRRRRSRYDETGGTCAVIMAAHNAARWIGSALESIAHQDDRRGWTYQVRIGVDGCEATSAALLELGFGHWYSPKNVGPYIIRNSLIGLGPADAYAIFDADDVMRPEYLSTLLGLCGRTGIAGAGRDTIDAEGRIVARRRPYQHGVALFTADAWAKLGGYRGWPMVADHEIILRAKGNRIPIRVHRGALYFRRRHAESLTQAKDTGMGSDLREGFRALAESLGVASKPLTPKTTALEWREAPCASPTT